MDRYKPRKVNVGGLGQSHVLPKRDPNMLAGILRGFGSLIPAVSTGVGAAIGGPAGAAALGGAGKAVGEGLYGGAADWLEGDELDEEQRRLAREQDNAARQDVAMRLLGGL